MLAYITTAIDIATKLSAIGGSIAPIAQAIYTVAQSGQVTDEDWKALAKIADEQTAIIQAKIP